MADSCPVAIKFVDVKKKSFVSFQTDLTMEEDLLVIAAVKHGSKFSLAEAITDSKKEIKR